MEQNKYKAMKLPKIDVKMVVIVVLAILLVISMATCSKRDGQISQLQLDKQTTDSIVNKYGQTILLQESIVTNNKQAIKDLTDSLFNLKKSQDKKIKDVIAYYKGITKTSIVEVDVPYVDSVMLENFSDSIRRQCGAIIDYYDANTVSVPRTARDSTEHYTADLTVTQTGVTINNISIPDSQYIRFVTLKGGLLKKNQEGKLKFWLKPSVQVQVLHTNPLISVTGQNSAIYVAPKKGRWLEKTLLIGAGVFLGTKL